MRKLIFLFIVLIFFSCKKEVDDVTFDVSVKSSGALQAGQPVVFNIVGNPNYVTFYSGENGGNYDHRNTTNLNETSMKAFLRFTAKVESAAANNSLSLLMSDSFKGLVANNYKADSTAIVDGTWDELTTIAALPTTQNQEKNIEVDITGYLNKQATVAFKYAPTPSATVQQPKWTISNFRIVLQLANGYERESQDSLRRGFLPFDFNNKTAPYTNSAAAGRWNITANQKSFVMTNTAAGLTQTSNLDYAISRPMLLNTVSPDFGVTVKSVKDRINSYSYVFEKSGVYDVVFVAKNADSKSEKEIIKRITVDVK
ncbi:DUF5017 domain-containing protein [Pedobacter helvus]|uniref:DUF5017 domain-containing protein n=1 Tax=Pedobacter helvus TaxID=2563444 RepID=A0ABW9JMY6_9SPHI|nr:DUF5017 domain-containing protein [Pedobacter ureilyticus]